MGKKKEQYDDQLDKLTVRLLEKGCFKIPLEDLDFKVNELLLRKDILEENGILSVPDGLVLSAPGIRYFKTVFNFKMSANEKKLAVFLNQIEDFFKDHDVIMGLHNFLRNVYQSLILEFRSHKGNLIKLAKALDKEQTAIYSFCSVIEERLVDLSLSSTEIINLVEWLCEELKAEDEGILNIDLIVLGKGIRKLCQADKKVGEELFSKCVDVSPQKLITYHCSIIRGLLDGDPNFVQQIQRLIRQPETMNSAVCALSTTPYIDMTPLQRYIDLVEAVANPTDHFLQELPRFYCNIINSGLLSAVVLGPHCFKKLQELIALENINVLVQLMRELKFMKSNEEQIVELMESLIQQDSFKPGYSKGVMDVCTPHRSSKVYFRLLRGLIFRLRSEFPFDDIRDSCRLLYSVKREEFEKELVGLLVEDFGLFRMWAVRILTTLQLRNRSGFSISLDQFDDFTKVKLVISITSDMAEPGKIVPFLIPLIRSDNEYIVELVMHRLEILTENYGTSVITTLEQFLNPAIATEQIHLERLRNRMNELEAVSDQKWKLKELDPRYTSFKYLSQFRKSEGKKMRKIMDAQPKNGFLSMIDTIQLMKGGGFKIGEKEGVSPLSTLTTSMSLPREYVVSPEQFDWERKILYNENWKGKFDLWAAILS